MKHLMVVGVRANARKRILGDQDFHEILARLQGAPKTPDFTFATCSDPGELEGIVEATRGDIDLLDIYYHGKKGTMFLGGTKPKHVLFASKADSSPLQGAEYAHALQPYLRPNAHVRLLGCVVGKRTEGRMLLHKLAYELGGARVAFAPIGDIIPSHFNLDGRFTTPEYLFSSLGALDREAPTKDERDFETPKYP